MGKRYPMLEQQTGCGSAVLQCERASDTPVAVRPPLPGAVIVIHGVNDVGTAFDSVERGLCAGLHTRLGWATRWIQPADYRMPTPQDNSRVEADPDAVFFKRRAGTQTYSPVIPFYWGYREVTIKAQQATEAARHGQCVDRYGNRLDKDMSKGGGPFANATTTLPDMWNRGAPGGFDAIKRDPYRPVLRAPGRMYMILAAQRLAALVGMIHDYDDREVVSIVAHSQGCLVTLLAQAFLLQQNERPADTLVLNNPPYSLEEELGEALGKTLSDFALFGIGGGTDAAMAPHYAVIESRQTMRARLDTLARIVKGVHEKRQPGPGLIGNADAKKLGLVGTRWQASADRDNRGKVYLYFCPEDMTVGLRNIQGIGWQGVPDQAKGRQLIDERPPADKRPAWTTAAPEPAYFRLSVKALTRPALADLGTAFRQRVFTNKQRPPDGYPGSDSPELVGCAPHSFRMRLDGEDDHAHVRASEAGVATTHLDEGSRRTINGEPLPAPFAAQLNAQSLASDGREEAVDPIDAAIAVTSDYGLEPKWMLIDDPSVTPSTSSFLASHLIVSPQPTVYGGFVLKIPTHVARLDRLLNSTAGGDPIPEEEQRVVLDAYQCAGRDASPTSMLSRQFLIRYKETPNAARLRHQHSKSGSSFHGAIFGGPTNHECATAYDVAIGGGQGVSHPLFHAYLCAVADWRLKQVIKGETARVGILKWSRFLESFSIYWAAESPARMAIIEANSNYYSNGLLPELPLPTPQQLPPAVICETLDGRNVVAVDSDSHAVQGDGPR